MKHEYLKHGKWEQRTYEIGASASEVNQMRSQMIAQDESKDTYILLKVEYNPSKGIAKITDKVKLTETQSPQLPKEARTPK